MGVGALRQQDTLPEVLMNLVLNYCSDCFVFDLDSTSGVVTDCEVFLDSSVVVSTSYDDTELFVFADRAVLDNCIAA
jgi:hypothetical protein